MDPKGPIISQFKITGGHTSSDLSVLQEKSRSGSPVEILEFKTVQIRTDDNISGMDGKLSLNPFAGLDNEVIEEIQPEYNTAGSEKEIKGQNNARIILGRDRQHMVSSGYGGRGHTRAGAIDIVVGLQGYGPAEGAVLDKETGTIIPPRAEKNFGSMSNDKPGDSARIYMSQRADIDDYFDLCDGNVGRSIADSAIGIKADSIRIMARKGIKLVTAQNPPGRNALGGELLGTFGIDLIAGNRDRDTSQISDILQEEDEETPYLQPIPKGYNLEEYLLQLSKRVENLNNLFSSFVMLMRPVIKCITLPRYGANAGGPIITSIFPPPPTPPPPALLQLTRTKTDMYRLLADLRLQSKVFTTMNIDYLNIMGKKYINSRYNRTN